ncbi:hypothetical protein K1T71_011423 [Dendrolimus kikuchii]|uniref:Uncharacterized protein n=1 Tax=Dendrolimus kikuchii TaxID=765133 RepID=A0ACC1CP52_9NEOP|nr:hypothetical protein K1T71_011423 [Dendrolimus kikuchii]
MQIVAKVILYRNLYTICYITEDSVIIQDKQCCKALGLKNSECDKTGDIENVKTIQGKSLKYTATALFLKPFVFECMNSDIYRAKVLTYLTTISGCPANGTVFLKLILEPPDSDIIDYAWNDRVLRLIWTRVEIENAFSWLSTLGGAYSALGDYFEHCAEEAGRISIRQYKLSKILGDDGLAARSRLYSALAYAQKGHLHTARNIVRKVAEFARLTHDQRLNRMCQGVWAKLKYLRSLKHSTNCKENNANGKVLNSEL